MKYLQITFISFDGFFCFVVVLEGFSAFGFRFSERLNVRLVFNDLLISIKCSLVFDVFVAIFSD